MRGCSPGAAGVAAMRAIRNLFCAAALLHGMYAEPAAAASLTCRYEPAHPVLGHPVVWRIHARDLPQPLPDWRPDDFGENWLLHGQSASRSVDSSGHTLQSVEVTLYPMASGELKLPSLDVGSLHCAAAQIEIAAHAPGESALHVASRIDPAQPMVGQATRIELNIGGPGGLVWEPIAARAANASLRELPTIDTASPIPNDATTQWRDAWDLLPLRPGPLDIHFGLLKARRFGQLMIYPPARLVIQVRPLPAFWPVDLPVGRPQFLAPSAPRQLQVGGLGVLRVRLRAAGLRAQTLEGMIAATVVPAGLNMYPPRISQLDEPGQGLQQIWLIDWPFRVERAGPMRYPILRLPYEDPVLGAPQVADVSWGAVQVDDPGALRLRYWALAIFLLIGLFAAVGSAYKAAKMSREKRWWIAIGQHQDARALRTLWAITRKDSQESSSTPTLRKWLARQARDGMPVSQSHVRLVEEIELCDYGPQGCRAETAIRGSRRL